MLSKVENGQRSLTYDKLIQLADTLSVDVSRLFSNHGPDSAPSLHMGRRSVQHDGDGFVVEAGVYTYRYLAQDLVAKKFTPVLMEISAGSLLDFDDLLSHEGEEFAFVLEGMVDVYTESYAPLRLRAGESVYLDSRMGHAYVNVGPGPARILNIASQSGPGKAADGADLMHTLRLDTPSNPPGDRN